MSAIPSRWWLRRRLAQAEDAAELIEVDYDAAALRSPHRRVRRRAAAGVGRVPGQHFERTRRGERAATEAFARAKPRRAATLHRSRACTRSIWSRAVRSASTTPRDERYTLYSRRAVAASRARDCSHGQSSDSGKHQIRVVAGDIGGGFGTQGAGDRASPGPVGGQAPRSAGEVDVRTIEAMLADEHGRDNVEESSLRSTPTASFSALRSHWIANVGAYINARPQPAGHLRQHADGLSASTAFRPPTCARRCVMTHTNSTAPYRAPDGPKAILS